MLNENNSTNEDRFGRQDQQQYSGRTSAITIGVIAIILCIVVLAYYLKY